MNRSVLKIVVTVVLCILIIHSNSLSSERRNTKKMTNLTVSSSAFQNNGIIPKKYANAGYTIGLNLSIPVAWSKGPAGTKSYALLMTDASAGNFIHWMVVNITSETTSLAEGASGGDMPEGSYELSNDFDNIGYGGPTPPRGTGVHNYVIKIFALSVPEIDLRDPANLSKFNNTISGKILSQGFMTGKMSYDD